MVLAVLEFGAGGSLIGGVCFAFEGVDYGEVGWDYVAEVEVGRVAIRRTHGATTGSCTSGRWI